MDYTLIRRRGQKNLRMHFNAKGVLIVSAPYYVSEREVKSFVNVNSTWIAKQEKKQQKHSFTTGDCIFFFGKKYDLVVNQASKDSIQIVENLLLIYCKKTDASYVEKEVRKFYLQSLKDFTLPRFEFYSSQLGVDMPEVKFNNAYTKWGSCARSHNTITISLMTCVLDKRLIDMIVLHEVCHLIYPNHQAEFWNLMKKYMPDIDDRKKALRAISREGYHRNLFN